ncbi:MAG: hypothetical protein R6U43_04460 [Candidatus Krumholzibacteriales bacterium]
MINVIFPLFDAIDGLLAALLPPLVRICLWGVVAGALSVAVYALISPQDKIAGYKEQLRKYRRELMGNQDLEFKEYMAVSRKNLKTSMLFFSSAIGPALVSAVPVIVLLLYLHTSLGYTAPETLSAEAPAGGVKLQLSQTQEEVTVRDGNNRVLYSGNPLHPPVPSVSKRWWWNALFENPAGYIRDDAEIDEIRFNTSRRIYLGFMPGWGQGVELPYFLLVFITALSGRIIFRIK